MSLYKYRHIFLWIVAAVLITGCQPVHEKDPYAPVIRTPKRVSRQTLGHSIQQRPIELISAGIGSEVILVLATIHGNEDAGTPLVHELLRVLRQRPQLLDGRTVLIVPVANPDGMVLRTRGNAAGIDLNRNFPASNRINSNVHGDSGLTEPESKILHDLILSRRPIRILSLHQPLDCLDYDGPGAALAYRMQSFCALPVKKLGARPGSLGAFSEEHNIPIITMELKASDSRLTPGELWIEYGPAVLAFIMYPRLPY